MSPPNATTSLAAVVATADRHADITGAAAGRMVLIILDRLDQAALVVLDGLPDLLIDIGLDVHRFEVTRALLAREEQERVELDHGIDSTYSSARRWFTAAQMNPALSRAHVWSSAIE